MSLKIPDEKVVDELLSRSVSKILPSKELLKRKMMAGERLKIYLGADATGVSLHLGHATNYMILERFRRLGHEVIVLIGDFTASIGDPTDKSATRIQLSRERVLENCKNWLTNISPIVDFSSADNPAKIVYNNDWLADLNFIQVSELSSHFTVQQMINRDMFQKRIKENKEIYLHEFFYPMMQGFDSVALNIDVELCGNDQLFNALAGRDLVKDYQDREKFVITTTLLQNPITGEKMMSKSLGTGVFLNETRDVMYNNLLKQPIENVPQLLIDCSYLPLDEIHELKRKVDSGNISHEEAKVFMAKTIVDIYHSSV